MQFSIRSLDFWGMFPLFSKIGQILPGLVLLMSNIKLGESYIFGISIKTNSFDVFIVIKIPFSGFWLPLGRVPSCSFYLVPSYRLLQRTV